jgi:glycosyltransferase involved in cell wall biosynthesis
MPESVRAAKRRGWLIWSDQILNQSVEMTVRIAQHEEALGLADKWQHSEQMNDEIIAAADVITVPSVYTLDGIRDRIRPNTRIQSIPYGASTAQFAGCRLTNHEHITILVRAHSIRKGGHLFLSALQQCGSELLRACIPKRIEVIVLGNLESTLNSLLEKITLPEGISVKHGNVPHSEVALMYRQASLFIMPSLSESMSLACIEALHAGLPLIITKYCGIDTFISGEMGYEIEDTVESLKCALISAFKNQELWDQWGNNSRKVAQELTWEAYTANISRLCTEVLS